MITHKQSKTIMLIEHYTNHIFNGITHDEAVDFISKYFDEYVSMANTPSNSQIQWVNDICKRKRIKHKCKTRREYADFIADHTGNYIR